jgi:hypothetical protein
MIYLNATHALEQAEPTPLSGCCTGTTQGGCCNPEEGPACCAETGGCNC